MMTRSTAGGCSYLVAHMDLAGEDALRQRLVEETASESASHRLGDLAYHHHAHYAVTTGYWSLRLVIAQRCAQLLTGVSTFPTATTLRIAQLISAFSLHQSDTVRIVFFEARSPAASQIS